MDAAACLAVLLQHQGILISFFFWVVFAGIRRELLCPDAKASPTNVCFSLTTLFSMDPCTPHIWLVRLLFQSEQCFPLTTFQSEQCFSVNFSQDSVSRTGPKCTAWWSPKRKNDRCQRGDNLKQAYFIEVPMRGKQIPYFETLWFPNQAANV